MKKTIITLFLLLSASPAFAIEAVWFDGATRILSTQNPGNMPFWEEHQENGYRHGVISFWYQSTGQYHLGYVMPFQVQYPNSQDDSSAMVIMTNVPPYGNGDPDCPDLQYQAEYYGWDATLGNPGNNYTLSDSWSNQDCDNRPDNKLYNSGRDMGLALLLTSDENYTKWVWATADGVLPQNGKLYNVQIYYSTGEYGSPGPWVSVFVTQKWSSQVIQTNLNVAYNDDALQNGFDVPMKDMFWQVGCLGPGNYGDSATCYRGGLSEFWLNSFEVEVNPYGSVLNKFITPEGTGQDLGGDGSAPWGYPPVLFLAGDHQTFNVNSADLNLGGPTLQYFEVNGYTVGDNSIWNDTYGYLVGGTLNDDFQDPF